VKEEKRKKKREKVLQYLMFTFVEFHVSVSEYMRCLYIIQQQAEATASEDSRSVSQSEICCVVVQIKGFVRRRCWLVGGV